MKAIELEQNIEYSNITSDLLNRIGLLKNGINNSMVCGDTFIIEGIELFETVIKKLNIDTINDETVVFIEKSVDSLMTNIQERRQTISGYMQYGINCCYTVLEGYLRNTYVRKRK